MVARILSVAFMTLIQFDRAKFGPCGLAEVSKGEFDRRQANVTSLVWLNPPESLRVWPNYVQVGRMENILTMYSAVCGKLQEEKTSARGDKDVQRGQ